MTTTENWNLFVCRFVDFDKSKNKFCGDERKGERYYCIPRVYHLQKAGSFTTMAMAPLPTSLKNPASAKRSVKPGAWLPRT